MNMPDMDLSDLDLLGDDDEPDRCPSCSRLIDGDGIALNADDGCCYFCKAD